MALGLTVDGDGDTEEDEEIAHIVNVQPKQRATISKGKKRDLRLSQQSDRESCLHIIVVHQLTNFLSSIVCSNSP